MTALSAWVLDFETASGCDLKEAGSWRYAEDPTTEILNCGYKRFGGNERVVWHPGEDIEEFVAIAADDYNTFIAHHAGFEKAIWRKIMVETYGFPDIPNSRWHDTMATCAMKVLPLDLDRATMVLRLPIQKDKEGSALVKSLSKPNKKTGLYDRSPETLARIDTYVLEDVDAEEGLHRRIGYLPPGERSVWLLDQRINERGLKLDLPFIRAARKIVADATAPLAKEFSTITGGLKFTQNVKIVDWCQGQGATRITSLNKEFLKEDLGLNFEEDDDGEYESLADSGDEDNGGGIILPPHVKRALAIRGLVGSASVKKLPRMEACVCSDGIARALVQYHGAGPGRWAGRLFQPHNFPRGTLKDENDLPYDPEVLVAAIMTGDYEYVEMMFGKGAVEVVVSSLRHAIVAREGRMLCAGDFNTIELRVNLALAGQQDKLDLLAAGGDPYIDMAQLIYKRPLNKKQNVEERQTGKNSVLGLGFQMGAPKFQKKYAKKHPLEFAKDIVDIFRKTWAPKIPDLWWGLARAATKAVWDGTPQEAFGIVYQLEDAWLTARLPSGRKLWYFNPQKVREAMPWDDTDIRRSFTFQAMKQGQWRTIKAFGGLLTENVVQATARDLMCSAMFKAEKNGFPVILTVHDEIVTEPEKGDPTEAKKALEQIMADIPDWAKQLQIPVKAEAWAGERYRK